MSIGWIKGRPRSEETKRKISESLKGRPKPPMSDEHRKHIGDAQRGIKRGPYSEERKKAIGDGRRGIMHTEEAKRRISEGHIGQVAWNVGKSWSEESKRKMSEARKGRFCGEDSPTWKGGVSKSKEYHNMYKRRYKLRKKSITGSYTHDEWVAIKERNGCSCAGCGKHESERKLTVDHIVPISKGGTDNADNIQPLCRSCNSRKHNKISNTEYLRKD